MNHIGPPVNAVLLDVEEQVDYKSYRECHVAANVWQNTAPILLFLKVNPKQHKELIDNVAGNEDFRW